jgi:hypothetical protein
MPAVAWGNLASAPSKLAPVICQGRPICLSEESGMTVAGRGVILKTCWRWTIAPFTLTRRSWVAP